MNNSFLSVSVFLALLFSSLVAGHHGYRSAKGEIAAELNRALALTLQEGSGLVTQDSIKAYKQLRAASDGKFMLSLSDETFCGHLREKRLKEFAFITFDLVDDTYRGDSCDDGTIYSDTLFVTDEATEATIAFRSYVRLSEAALFGLSDQRLSFALAFASLLWATGTWFYRRRRAIERQAAGSFGGMTYVEEERCFYDADHAPIHFTPMQRQLLLLFWEAPAHRLSKEEICAALWPKKEDANSTLYTLVKRLKPVVESRTDLKIVADRERGYLLEIKKSES